MRDSERHLGLELISFDDFVFLGCELRHVPGGVDVPAIQPSTLLLCKVNKAVTAQIR